jgi:hypothetical protein
MMATQEPRRAEARPVVKLFNGRYTIESTRTGEHRTFWVETQAADAEFAPGKRVVSLLTGSQNDDPDSYTSFGFVDDDGIHVFTSKRGPGKQWEVYADLLWTLALDGAFSPWSEKGYRIHLEGRCVVCNRPLTTPESIRHGIGPVCAERGL